jgi:hypothetical protein
MQLKADERVTGRWCGRIKPNTVRQRPRRKSPPSKTEGGAPYVSGTKAKAKSNTVRDLHLSSDDWRGVEDAEVDGGGHFEVAAEGVG